MKKDFVAREIATVYSVETQTRIVIQTKCSFLSFLSLVHSFFLSLTLMILQNEIFGIYHDRKICYEFLTIDYEKMNIFFSN